MATQRCDRYGETWTGGLGYINNSIVKGANGHIWKKL